MIYFIEQYRPGYIPVQDWVGTWTMSAEYGQRIKVKNMSRSVLASQGPGLLIDGLVRIGKDYGK